MNRKMVCAAAGDQRLACDNRCHACGFLKADRRASRESAICWTLDERRTISNLLPFSYSLAEGDGSLSTSRPWTRRLPAMLLALLLTFNFLDMVLTARALSLGVAEANPVMAALFEISIPFGMVAKFAVVSAGGLILWRLRHLPLAARGMGALTASYGAVVLYHLAFQAAV
ncbi:MAG: hypothetical protein IBX61_03025 [Thermoleophilia bacterium]|nr:hypothetical protein [Thermoleophilia bacterium]